MVKKRQEKLPYSLRAVIRTAKEYMSKLGHSQRAAIGEAGLYHWRYK